MSQLNRMGLLLLNLSALVLLKAPVFGGIEDILFITFFSIIGSYLFLTNIKPKWELDE